MASVAQMAGAPAKRLARRARSFKEDLLDKLYQMRSPTSSSPTLNRTLSPSRKASCSQMPHSGINANDGLNQLSPTNSQKGERGGHRHYYGRHHKRKGGRGGVANWVNDTSPKNYPDKIEDIGLLQKEVHCSMQYIQDVIEKNMLELLPGSASVALETVLAVVGLLRNCLPNDQSSALQSAFSSVFQSLAALLRWTDSVLMADQSANGTITANNGTTSSLPADVAAQPVFVFTQPSSDKIDTELFKTLVNALQQAVKRIVEIALEQLSQSDTCAANKLKFSLTVNGNPRAVGNSVTQQPPSPIHSSMPDIPLTPREKDILYRTAMAAEMTSRHSTGDLLDDDEEDNPPPKPPLSISRSADNRCRLPSADNLNCAVIPPLPPKKRLQLESVNNAKTYGSDWMRTGMASRSSTVESSYSRSTSPLSLSSLDSSLNRSSDILNMSTGSDGAFCSHGTNSVSCSHSNSCYFDSGGALAGSMNRPSSRLSVNGDYNSSSSRNGKLIFSESSSTTRTFFHHYSSSTGEGIVDGGCVSSLAAEQRNASLTKLQEQLSRISCNQHNMASSGLNKLQSPFFKGHSLDGFTSEVSCSKGSHPSHHISSVAPSTQQQIHRTQRQITAKARTQFFQSNAARWFSLQETDYIPDEVEAQEDVRKDIVLMGGVCQGSDVPPPIPPKQKGGSVRSYFHSAQLQRTPSLYDNLDDTSHETNSVHNRCYSLMHSKSMNVDDSSPPPLPPKKKQTVSTYMEIIGSRVSEVDPVDDHLVSISKSTVRTTYSSYSITSGYGCEAEADSSGAGAKHLLSRTNSKGDCVKTVDRARMIVDSDKTVPPILPPKRKKSFKAKFQRQASVDSKLNNNHKPESKSDTNCNALQETGRNRQRVLHRQSTIAQSSTECETPTNKSQSLSPTSPKTPIILNGQISRGWEKIGAAPSNAAPLDKGHEIVMSPVASFALTPSNITSLPFATVTSSLPGTKMNTSSCLTSPGVMKSAGITSPANADFTSLLDELDVDKCIVYKNGDDGRQVHGAPVDALIIHATKGSKENFEYQESFLATYRTFVNPLELIRKLVYRYERFGSAGDVTRQRDSRNAFSLLVRVVDDLCVSELSTTLPPLTEFVCDLVCSGELTLARALRTKILERVRARKKALESPLTDRYLSSMPVSTKNQTLLDFKMRHLAEQMTLLDAELFMKIETAEVLIWGQEQSEDISPNLHTFMEHFNNMSYWARSRILEQTEAKDRERYVLKFLKLIKHLRALNNFNSYLAVLAALDSAPIRRLEWHKHITEGLKEYCALIDSSCSFRAYRQALAETEPPCIPYMGLILQDLTFVHIGNSDVLSEEGINYGKRWQQYHILDSMRRFRKCKYNFRRSERIMAFFNGFTDVLPEEALWQISESLKPRGGVKKKASDYND